MACTSIPLTTLIDLARHNSSTTHNPKGYLLLVVVHGFPKWKLIAPAMLGIRSE
jgi:hypothetical protein